MSFGHVVDVFCTQNDTSGGSSDTGTKVLAARPDAHAVDLRGDRDDARREVPERLAQGRRAQIGTGHSTPSSHAAEPRRPRRCRGNVTLDMWITLLAMAVAVSLEPFRIGMTILMINRPRPILQLLAFLAGGFAMGIAVGVIVLFVLRPAVGSAHFTLPRVQIIVGAVLLLNAPGGGARVWWASAAAKDLRDFRTPIRTARDARPGR